MSEIVHRQRNKLLSNTLITFGFITGTFVINPLIAMGLLAFWPSFGQYWPQYQRFAEHCSAHPCVFPAEIVGATYNLHFFFTTLILIPSQISTYRFTTDSKKDFLKIVIMCFIIQLPNWVVGNFSFRSDNIFSNGVDHNKIYIYYPVLLDIFVLFVPVAILIHRCTKGRHSS